VRPQAKNFVIILTTRVDLEGYEGFATN